MPVYHCSRHLFQSLLWLVDIGLAQIHGVAVLQEQVVRVQWAASHRVPTHLVALEVLATGVV